MKKKILALIITFYTAVSLATDNTIYIDQAGDNANITILQDGSGNRVRGIQGVGTGNTTPSILNGDAILVDIQQIGSGNILNMGVITTTANGSAPTSINFAVTGNNSTATLNLNNTGVGINESTLLDITQSGDGGIININILGSNNNFTADQRGGNNNQLMATINALSTLVNIDQSGGGGNQTTLNLTGDKGQVDITTVGATNTTNITQSGGAVSGHNTIVNLTGSGNNTIINQSGNIDTIVNIVSVGSGNTFSITTTN
jgi:hypothetical protein